ncbi:hypothetical protein NDU88_006296 [Pleurodeles waltl]|uniref:Uncharacterized protein n=1 Tax=Pleurodeles waltl TaxID=8319 RepID=A0AAV7WX73_PLEWA|nr:hypothetical protein NDU88_006296 [Pleurodeles waltl]
MSPRLSGVRCGLCIEMAGPQAETAIAAAILCDSWACDGSLGLSCWAGRGLDTAQEGTIEHPVQRERAGGRALR